MGSDRRDAMSDEVVSAEEAQARVTQLRSVVDELAREAVSPRARETEILREIERLKRDLDAVWATERAQADANRLQRAIDPESLPSADEGCPQDLPSATLAAAQAAEGLPSWAAPGVRRPVASRGGPLDRGPSEIPVSVRRAPGTQHDGLPGQMVAIRQGVLVFSQGGALAFPQEAPEAEPSIVVAPAGEVGR